MRATSPLGGKQWPIERFIFLNFLSVIDPCFIRGSLIPHLTISHDNSVSIANAVRRDRSLRNYLRRFPLVGSRAANELVHQRRGARVPRRGDCAFGDDCEVSAR